MPPTVDVAEMHPAVWGQAARLWRDGHYRQAVSAAADGVIGLVKSRTGRNDVPDTSQWQQAFSKDDPEPGKPRLRWPGNQTDQTVKSMNDGLRQFAPGAQMTIRNPAAHGPGELTQQEAVERLSVLSLLARWVDQCDTIEAPDHRWERRDRRRLSSASSASAWPHRRSTWLSAGLAVLTYLLVGKYPIFAIRISAAATMT